MKASTNCINIIKKYEGFRSKAYLCPAQIWTIGFGATFIDGKKVKEGDSITRAEAEVLLIKQLEGFSKAVRIKMRQSYSQHEFDAFVSLAYNIGIGNFNKSDALKFFNKGKKLEVVLEIQEWRRAKGIILKGLVLRRLEEAKLFIAS